MVEVGEREKWGWALTSGARCPGLGVGAGGFWNCWEERSRWGGSRGCYGGELEYMSTEWAQGPPKLSSGSPRTLTGAPELASRAKADTEGCGRWRT